MNSLPTLKMKKKLLIEFLPGNFLVFLSTYNKAPLSGYLEKEWLINAKKIDVVKVPKPT